MSGSTGLLGHHGMKLGGHPHRVMGKANGIPLFGVRCAYATEYAFWIDMD